MIALDLLGAMGPAELWQFLGLVVLLDVPRYLLAAICLAAIPPQRPAGGKTHSVCGLIACYNEEDTIAACVASMRANGVEQIVVVNDGSTDHTYEIAAALDVTLVDLPARMGKPAAMNAGLPHCTKELVLVADADTTFEPGCVLMGAQLFEPGVGGVGLDLKVRNENASLITQFQAIEYEISFAMRRIADALGILPNVSGAAGLFRVTALVQVGGWSYAVAEDATLAMKLRTHGWELRFAPLAHASTAVPETMIDLIMQRLRWDAGIITVWWREFGFVLNPFSARFDVRNLFTSLDVLLFNAVLPLVLVPYLFWLMSSIDSDSLLILIGATLIALALVELMILLLLEVPLRLLLYVPLFILLQTLVMRPTRVIALVGELAFNITRRDDYVPRSERWRLR